MSDLAATNCGCGCDNNCGCDNCDNRMGFFGNNSCSWIIILILLFGCCGNNGCGNGCGDNDNGCCWIIVLLLLFCGNGNGFLGCGC